MNLSTMRRVDRWVGAPLCGALSLWRRLFGRCPGPEGPKNILIIQLSEMGSLALAWPAVQRLQALQPRPRVRFLVFARNRMFLELLDMVEADDIWTIDDRSPLAFAQSSLRFVRQARRVGIDTVVDFELFSRASMILSALSGARRRAGFDQYRAEGLYRGALLTHPVFYNVYKHIAHNFMALAVAIGDDQARLPLVKQVIDAPLTLPRRPPAPDRTEAMRRRLAERCPALTDRTQVILVSPFSGNLLPLRAWPASHYSQWIGAMLERHGDAVVVVMGLPEAAPYCRPIFEAVGSERLIDFIGQTRDIGEVIDLIQIAHLFVTSDSGPPHFASLTNTATLVLFGPECPMLYGPLGDNVTTVYLGLSCSPCVTAFNHRDTPCDDNQCLQGIAPERVVELAEGLLE